MLVKLRNLFRRRQLDRELEADCSFTWSLSKASIWPAASRPRRRSLAARRDFGGIVRAREACREHRRIPIVETVSRDIRFSLRSMWRTPVTSLAVVATLAIGIGANIAIFSVVNGVLIKPLPYPDPERLITMSHAAPGAEHR